MSPVARAEALQASLIEYHERLATQPDQPMSEWAARLFIARCAEALAEVRGAAAVILAGAIDLIDEGQPAAARTLLQSALPHYQDKPEGATVQ